MEESKGKRLEYLRAEQLRQWEENPSIPAITQHFQDLLKNDELFQLESELEKEEESLKDNEYLSNAEKMDAYCDVMRSRYGRKFVKTFLSQCAKNGIRETIYRSKPDSSERKLKFGAFLTVSFWWNDPDYPTETAYCVSAIRREQMAMSAAQPKTEETKQKKPKPRPGVEDKTFIYADKINLKAHEYLIDKPAIFRSGLNYKKSATQFRRDLDNGIFEQDHIFEVRNRQTGKPCAKMAIKKNPGNTLFDRIGTLSDMHKRIRRQKNTK